MTAPVFVDTNVLVYAQDASEGEKQERASAWIEHLWRTGTGRIGFQVLQEYYVTVTRKLAPGIKPPDARDCVRALLVWNPVGIDAALYETAWRIEDRYGLSWWDALVVSAASLAGCGTLLSEDFQAGQTFEGVTVVNPFRTHPPDAPRKGLRRAADRAPAYVG